MMKRGAFAACLLLSALPATAGPISRADFDAAVAQASAAVDAMVTQDATTQAALATAQSTLAIAQQQLATAQATIAADQTAIAAKDSLISKLRGMAPAPTVALTANPATINLGETSTLSLAAVNTETCTPTGWDMLAPVVKPQVDTLYKVDCTGWNGAAVSAQAQVAVTIPLPPQPPQPQPQPSPTPAPVASADNVITLTNVSGSARTAQPVQLGRAFIPGEIKQCPGVVGLPSGTSQVVVKSRWPDNSVKFAVVNAVADLPVTGSVALKFSDQVCATTAPISAADLLAQYSADASMELTQPGTLIGTVDADTSKSSAVWLGELMAKLKPISDGSLAFSVDDKVYQVTGINLTGQTTIEGSATIIQNAVVAAHLPVQFVLPITGKTYAWGGQTIALATPTSGTDLGPLLFRTTASQPSKTVTTATLRTMLANGNCKPWTSGPVAQQMICADRSAARAYDTGFSQWKSFHPEFIVTFWPTTKQVAIRYVGEITNSEALEAIRYNLKLKTANDQVIYTQDGINHSIATRWTRTIWLGGAPEPHVNIDHNIGYLADTGLIPNYDRSLKIPERAKTDDYARWATADRKIGGAGLWMKGMPNTGAHPEIGPMPVWYMRALYSGDYRDREIMLGQADLVGAFAMQVREGDPARFADRARTIPAIGRAVSLYARPKSWGLDVREGAGPDKIIVRSPILGVWHPDIFYYSGFEADDAHQPDPFTVPYLVTGDPHYLDGLQLWAGLDALFFNPDGRLGPYVVISGQVRAQAWVFRMLCNAWAMTPDDDPLQGVYATMLNDVLARWEGERGIKGTKYEGTQPWKNTFQYFGGPYDGWNGIGPSPLHWWGYGGYDVTPASVAWMYDQNVAASATSGFMNNFVVLMLGRAVEMGFDGAKPLFAWAAANIIGQAATPEYNPHLLGEYALPDIKKKPGGGIMHFVDFADMMRGWSDTKKAQQTIGGYFPNTGAEYFWDVARAALSISANLPNGSVGWQRYNDTIYQTNGNKWPDWSFDPTWAILPRTTH